MRILGLRSLGSFCLAGLLLGTQLAACKDTGTQDIYMSPDSGGERRRTEFVTDSENINVIIRYSTGRSDLTIRAEIFPVELADDTKFKTIIPSGPLEALATSGIGSVQTFTLQRVEAEELPPLVGSTAEDTLEGSPVEPWPVGDFRVRVLFDDEEVGVTAFKISWSECPNTPPLDNVPCRQFKPNGACRYNEGTVSAITCECATPIQEQKWVCTVGDSPAPGLNRVRGPRGSFTRRFFASAAVRGTSLARHFAGAAVLR